MSTSLELTDIVIELHASFLEENLHSQVRALPEPALSHDSVHERKPRHHLTLHLSPTTTANVVVVSTSPSPKPGVPCTRLLPTAEVIVAPKNRKEALAESLNSQREVVQKLNSLEQTNGGHNLKTWLLGTDVRMWGDTQMRSAVPAPEGHALYLSADAIESGNLEAGSWVVVTANDERPLTGAMDNLSVLRGEKGENRGSRTANRKAIAKVYPWDSAPDPIQALLSSPLCARLGISGSGAKSMFLEPAPPALPSQAVHSFGLCPFRSAGSYRSRPLKFGHKSKDTRAALLDKFQNRYGKGKLDIYAGPIHDGMILELPASDCVDDWAGVLVNLETTSGTQGPEQSKFRWTFTDGNKKPLNLRAETANPTRQGTSHVSNDVLAFRTSPHLVGLDGLPQRIVDWLGAGSSVLLTGPAGSGKSSLLRYIGFLLSQQRHYHVIHLDCTIVFTSDARVAPMKAALDGIFANTRMIAQAGGSSLVIIDNLVSFCPAETELQVGHDNGQKRQTAELFSFAMRSHCSIGSGAVVLASASSRDDLHVAVGKGDVFHESAALSAPGKTQRAMLLTAMIDGALYDHFEDASPYGVAGRREGLASPDGTLQCQSKSEPVYEALDVLEIASRTEGFMPGDLSLLVERAQNEKIIRLSTLAAGANAGLHTTDFREALRGFVPASLRNTSLTCSSTPFSSIGGLHEARSILLETLQYPTTYGPIFAQSAIRLRSGILLFGYPGCGKTLLAGAIASECDLNFISVKGPEVLNKYIGASEKSVRDLFERAQAAKPCILFFDEFDSLAPKRGHDSTGVTDRVVNQLLTQLDGAEGLSGVYVLAATSRPDLIDPALLRPGRLDKSLFCALPSVTERLEILKAHARQLEVDPGISKNLHDPRQNFCEIAQRTEGCTGADLQAIMYNAHLNAVQDTLSRRTESTGGAESFPCTRQLGPPMEGGIMEFEFAQQPMPDELRTGGQPLLGDVQGSHKETVLRETGLVEASSVLLDFARAQRSRKRARRPQNVNQPAEEARRRGPRASIQWRHFESSLTSTRCSINDSERLRLRGVYDEFLKSRSGEMATGEGSSGVGARSSLM